MERSIAGTTVTIEDDRVDGAIGQKLDQYLAGERVVFDESINLDDLTAFQRRVLDEIRRIPYGETVNYAELAEQVGNPDAVRAAANACGANPVPIVIPCHRVTGKNGIGGYSDGGSTVKQWLLDLENQ